MEDNKKTYSILGKSVPRVDTRLKVTGQAKYAADYEMGGMLWGKIKRAPYAHARILSIDTSKAERLPGVKGVVIGKEFGGVKWGWQAHTRDESPLAVNKVRYMYEGVAAVAAIDKEIAEEACDLIDVEYEELPAVFDPFEAMKEGAPLVHEDKPRNILVEYHWNFGDVDKAFDESYLVREDLFQTPRQAKGYIEPPAVVAWWEHDTLHYIGAKGSPYMLWRILGRAFNLPLNKVRIISPVVGCDFGGTKNDAHALDFASILLAKKTGRPVKIVYTQWEELTTCLRRHAMWVRVKMGLSKDGMIKGLYTNVVADGGAYARMSPVTMYLTNGQCTVPYKIDNFKTDTWNIYTNNPIAAAMSGHGMYHTRYAIDCQLDLMAKELGIDPVEIRHKNSIDNPKPGETYYTVNKLRVATCGIKECIEQTSKLFGWKEYQKREGRRPYCSRRRDCGIGIFERSEAHGPQLVLRHRQDQRGRERQPPDRRHGRRHGIGYGHGRHRGRGSWSWDEGRGDQAGRHRLLLSRPRIVRKQGHHLCGRGDDESGGRRQAAAAGGRGEGDERLSRRAGYQGQEGLHED